MPCVLLLHALMSADGVMFLHGARSVQDVVSCSCLFAMSHGSAADVSTILISHDTSLVPHLLRESCHCSAFALIVSCLQPKLKAKLEDSRYNIAMENHEFGVAPEAFTKWPILNDTYDIVSTSKDR